MTADLDRMRASLAALKMRVSRAVPADRVRMENTAAIIAQAIEAITTSRQALKRMRSGVSVEMIFHNAAAAFQSCPEVTQRLIVQAEEQLARNRAADAQAAAWLARFEAALDLDEAEALPRQALTPWNAHN
jgi:ATP-dependent DNA ligase